jgi:hypothetical protein
MLGDKYNVDKAARQLNMKTAEFTRTVVIQAAEQILAGNDETKKKPVMDPYRPPGGR